MAPCPEASRVNSRLGPVSELTGTTPLQRQGRAADSWALPCRPLPAPFPLPGRHPPPPLPHVAPVPAAPPLRGYATLFGAGVSELHGAALLTAAAVVGNAAAGHAAVRSELLSWGWPFGSLPGDRGHFVTTGTAPHPGVAVRNGCSVVAVWAHQVRVSRPRPRPRGPHHGPLAWRRAAQLDERAGDGQRAGACSRAH